MKKEKVEKGGCGEDSKKAQENSTETICHRAHRRECRIRQTGFDLELWILSLTWLSRPGKSCIILPSQGSLVK